MGGFDLAFERASATVLWQVEIDKNCRKLLESKWPNVEKFEDVKRCGTHNLKPVDIICGGFPCQDLSCAGKRKGLAGERSGLFYELARIVSELRPQFVLLENVKGLFSSNEGRDFAAVIGTLVDIGARDVGWTLLDAQWFGLAQRRERVFIVSDFTGKRAGEILSLKESLFGDPAPSRKAGQEIAGTLGSRTEGGGGRTTDLDGHGAYVAGCLQERDAKGPSSDTKPGHLIAVNTGQGYWRDSEQAGTLGTEARAVHENNLVTVATLTRGGSNPGGRRREDDENLVVVAPLSASPSSDAGATSDMRPLVFDSTQVTSLGNFSNPMPGAPCHPLSESASSPMVAYRTVASRSCIRRLTPVECERLQGYPDGYTEGFADTVRYRMLGNAVSVPVVEWIARRMLVAK